MKPLFTILASIALITVQAQVKELQEGSDLGQRMFGKTNAVEIQFEEEYKFEHVWEYELTLDGPITGSAKARNFQVHQNRKDSTMLLVDDALDTKTLHDARNSGVLTMRGEEVAPCVEMRKTIDNERVEKMVFAETGQVEIINGWKCALYLYEDDYHEYQLWINLDTDNSVFNKQLGTMLSIAPLAKAVAPGGLLVRYVQMRKVSGKNERVLDLLKDAKISMTLDTAPCWEIKPPEESEED